MRKLKNSELRRLDIKAFKAAQKMPLTLVLDNIRSLHNVGSVFRTADAYRVKEIILCGITATPPHKEIQKTALGATLTVDWHYEVQTLDAVRKLQQRGVTVWAVEQADEKIDASDFVLPEGELALVFGNEVKGVGDDVMQVVDAAIELPQFGSKHSLNVSVSAGIMIWEVFCKTKLLFDTL